jgi:predicted enzyme related to lactoylglutathione lyase
VKLSTARIFVRDLDAARSFYRDKLGLALRALSAERQTWGGILATFRDPAGNELQLVQAK